MHLSPGGTRVVQRRGQIHKRGRGRNRRSVPDAEVARALQRRLMVALRRVGVVLVPRRRPCELRSQLVNLPPAGLPGSLRFDAAQLNSAVDADDVWGLPCVGLGVELGAVLGVLDDETLKARHRLGQLHEQRRHGGQGVEQLRVRLTQLRQLVFGQREKVLLLAKLQFETLEPLQLPRDAGHLVGQGRCGLALLNRPHRVKHAAFHVFDHRALRLPLVNLTLERLDAAAERLQLRAEALDFDVLLVRLRFHLPQLVLQRVSSSLGGLELPAVHLHGRLDVRPRGTATCGGAGDNGAAASL
mmetsp:Transcript_9557/g.29540  ORF Transcript_9557/g.29540 Transcript_9557/m.29540 type:complete len:300 (-) Transcript_9557:67-966(-)